MKIFKHFKKNLRNAFLASKSSGGSIPCDLPKPLALAPRYLQTSKSGGSLLKAVKTDIQQPIKVIVDHSMGGNGVLGSSRLLTDGVNVMTGGGGSYFISSAELASHDISQLSPIIIGRNEVILISDNSGVLHFLLKVVIIENIY